MAQDNLCYLMVISSPHIKQVRRCNSSDRIYQLNKVYRQHQRYTVLNGGKLKTMKYTAYARELITDPLARLIYIVEFCKRNYNLKNLTMYGGVSVWNY